MKPTAEALKDWFKNILKADFTTGRLAEQDRFIAAINDTQTETENLFDEAIKAFEKNGALLSERNKDFVLSVVEILEIHKTVDLKSIISLAYFSRNSIDREKVMQLLGRYLGQVQGHLEEDELSAILTADNHPDIAVFLMRQAGTDEMYKPFFKKLEGCFGLDRRVDDLKQFLFRLKDQHYKYKDLLVLFLELGQEDLFFEFLKSETSFCLEPDSCYKYFEYFENDFQPSEDELGYYEKSFCNIVVLIERVNLDMLYEDFLDTLIEIARQGNPQDSHNMVRAILYKAILADQVGPQSNWEWYCAKSVSLNWEDVSLLESIKAYFSNDKGSATQLSGEIIMRNGVEVMKLHGITDEDTNEIIFDENDYFHCVLRDLYAVQIGGVLPSQNTPEKKMRKYDLDEIHKRKRPSNSRKSNGFSAQLRAPLRPELN